MKTILEQKVSPSLTELLIYFQKEEKPQKEEVGCNRNKERITAKHMDKSQQVLIIQNDNKSND